MSGRKKAERGCAVLFCMLLVYGLSYFFVLYGGLRQLSGAGFNDGLHGTGWIEPRYRIQGEWVETVFLPIHLLDRSLHRDLWYIDPCHRSSVEIMQGLE